MASALRFSLRCAYWSPAPRRGGRPCRGDPVVALITDVNGQRIGAHRNAIGIGKQCRGSCTIRGPRCGPGESGNSVFRPSRRGEHYEHYEHNTHGNSNGETGCRKDTRTAGRSVFRNAEGRHRQEHGCRGPRNPWGFTPHHAATDLARHRDSGVADAAGRGVWGCGAAAWVPIQRPSPLAQRPGSMQYPLLAQRLDGRECGGLPVHDGLLGAGPGSTVAFRSACCAVRTLA